MVSVTIIEEFTNEKKFANRVQDHLQKNPTSENTVHYAVSESGKGFLYSALIITK